MKTLTGGRTAGTARRAVAAAGAITASVIVLGACGVGNVIGPEHEDKVGYNVTDAVTKVRVESGSGGITVVESARSGIAVTETLQWRGNEDSRPKTSHEVNGGLLTLTYDCPGLVGNCSVEYRVEIPRGLSVKADTGSGEVVLRGLSGQVEATTGSGGINGADLTGKRVVGETGSGDVELRFGATPDDVRVETGSGNGVVRVPAGSYNVITETGSGEQQVEVGRDSAAPRKIDVSTGSGDVKVLPNSPA
ncbi:DUF4097 family beta strand repeat-containing protein [Thermopolyspora sp. NPDC052614]|uniref:DUF4097 family beta strand repeat-containing protein n=1 Tax=Thermopolyspora sp. NPDC052614 TaxID=3155682 RepID=UPI00344897ED